MLYTQQVKCWDGITRTTECVGYFADTDVLRHCLARWNGCMGPAGEPYQYFETLAQVRHNDGACCIKEELVPWTTGYWWGREQHHHTMGTAPRVPA
jgi:hypothetical protein